MKHWLIPVCLLGAALSAAAVTAEDYATREDLDKDIRASQAQLQKFIDDKKWPDVAQAGQNLAERIGILASFSAHLPVTYQDRIGELVIDVNATAGRLAEAAMAEDKSALPRQIDEMKRLLAEIEALFVLPKND